MWTRRGLLCISGHVVRDIAAIHLQRAWPGSKIGLGLCRPPTTNTDPTPTLQKKKRIQFELAYRLSCVFQFKLLPASIHLYHTGFRDQ